MFTQFAPPEHDFENWQQLELVRNMLANPHTMSAQVLEQQKQKHMEDAMSFLQQQQAQAAEQAGASGFALSGGRLDASSRAAQERMMDAILGKNRDMDIAAAQQNRADELQALQAAEGIMGGQIGRSGEVYGNILAGQQANRGDHWEGQRLDLQKLLGEKGIAVDMSRIASGDRQHAASLGEDARQFNSSNALGWATAGINGQNQLVQQILQMMGK
jgi:hypothetical protein